MEASNIRELPDNILEAGNYKLLKLLRFTEQIRVVKVI